MTFDLKATHRAIEAAFEAAGTTIAFGFSTGRAASGPSNPPNTPVNLEHMIGDAEQPFSLKDWHEAIEARIVGLDADNRKLSAETTVLRVDVDENQQLRERNRQLCVEIAALKKSAQTAADFRRRRPNKTVELERDSTGAVLRMHTFGT